MLTFFGCLFFLKDVLYDIWSRLMVHPRRSPTGCSSIEVRDNQKTNSKFCRAIVKRSLTAFDFSNHQLRAPHKLRIFENMRAEKNHH